MRFPKTAGNGAKVTLHRSEPSSINVTFCERPRAEEGFDSLEHLKSIRHEFLWLTTLKTDNLRSSEETNYQHGRTWRVYLNPLASNKTSFAMLACCAARVKMDAYETEAKTLVLH